MLTNSLANLCALGSPKSFLLLSALTFLGCTVGSDLPEISEAELLELLASCQVHELFQAHDLSVYVTTVDGSRYVFIQSEIDSVSSKLGSVPHPCPVWYITE